MKKEPVSFTSATSNPDYSDVKDIAPDELARKKNSVHVVDVRRPDEYTGELGHIGGAKLMTLDTVPDRLHELPKDETIVFVCRSGGRSGRASAFALENGFKDVYNLGGGMILWNELGLETER